MKHWPIYTTVTAFFVACFISGCGNTNAPAAKPIPQLQSQAVPNINQQSFVAGVRFGLLAKQRNQDIMDLGALAQIGYGLFMQEQAILAQQRTNQPPIVQVDTNTAKVVATNAPASTNAP